jgi:hypothetical protein
MAMGDPHPQPLNLWLSSYHNKDTIRLPKVKRNWGKQRTNYQAIKDWNDLDSDTRNASTLVSFKRNLIVFSKFLT